MSEDFVLTGISETCRGILLHVRKFFLWANADFRIVLKMIFPDSSIANKMSIGSTKMSYYGLGPFCHHNNFLQAIAGCSKILICFD